MKFPIDKLIAKYSNIIWSTVNNTDAYYWLNSSNFLKTMYKCVLIVENLETINNMSFKNQYIVSTSYAILRNSIIVVHSKVVCIMYYMNQTIKSMPGIFSQNAPVDTDQKSIITCIWSFIQAWHWVVSSDCY